jgi:SAM-dependent methyltransferase
MTDNPAATDASTSVRSAEFLWSSAEAPGSHSYLAGPVKAALRAAGADSVLDLGCGNGALTSHLARTGFTMHGLDGSDTGIRLARERYPGIPFDTHDLATPLPPALRGRFDAVIAVEVIEHLLLPRNLLASALQALRPGGLLVVTTPFHGYLKNLAIALAGGFDEHWHPLRDYGHIKFFSRRTLGGLLAEHGVADLRFQTAGRIPPLAKSMIFTGRKPA